MRRKFQHLHKYLAATALACVLPVTAAHASADSRTKSPYPVYPTIDYKKVKNPALVKEGEYLVKAGDCIACHTAEHSKQVFGGGLAFASPMGSLYSPNITFDKEHGIGKWSLKDFTRAMRQGVRPDGAYYYPAFPFRNFNILTDHDVKAIYAYLQAVPHISKPNKKDTMMFPVNWRFMQLGWRMLFFYPQKTGPYKADPKQSEAWNRGKYLVNGLGHCDMCHTQSYYLLSKRYIIAAPMSKYYLAGGSVPGGYHAPNITSKLMKGVPLKDIVDVFKHDRRIGGGEIAQKPMLEVNHDSLSYLTVKDLEAIGTYLKTVHSKERPVPNISGKDAGKVIYNTYCSGCHTTGAGGAPKFGSKAAWDPLIKTGMKTLYHNAIYGIGGMPKKGNCTTCTPEQIQYAVDYLVEAAKNSTDTDSRVVKPMKALTLADGKRVYQGTCAACHNPGSTNTKAPITGNKAVWTKIMSKGMDQVILNTVHGHSDKMKRCGAKTCRDDQVIAAIKYMISQSKQPGNYQLW